MRVGILAGEASGDLLGAKLITSLKAVCPDVQVEGIGGPAMIAAGCHSLFDIERLSVMGLVEPLFRLHDLIKLRRDIYRHFSNNPPDVFIGIDAPDFNLGLEIQLRQAGIPVVHYVSPSVWAWRVKRIHKIAKAVDLMLTLFPFEADFYRRHQVPVEYVGHPLAEQIPLYPDQAAAKRALCLNEKTTYVALLPGSRRQEIKHLAEPYLLAAKQAWLARPELRFITSHINQDRYQEFYDCYQKIAPELPLEFFTRRSQDIMAAADIVVVTSGTATLETMLYKKPMIIAYKMSKLTYAIAKRIVKTPFIGLPNLLANEQLVPELIQDKVTPENIASYLLYFLDNAKVREDLQNKFIQLHNELLTDSAAKVSEAILRIANKN